MYGVGRLCIYIYYASLSNNTVTVEGISNIAARKLLPGSRDLI